MSDEHATHPGVESMPRMTSIIRTSITGTSFYAFCVLTGVSVVADLVRENSTLPASSDSTTSRSSSAFIVLAVACAKAMFVMLYFMHLKFEGKWKFVLLAPTIVLAMAIPAASCPTSARITTITKFRSSNPTKMRPSRLKEGTRSATPGAWRSCRTWPEPTGRRQEPLMSPPAAISVRGFRIGTAAGRPCRKSASMWPRARSSAFWGPTAGAKRRCFAILATLLPVQQGKVRASGD